MSVVSIDLGDGVFAVIDQIDARLARYKWSLNKGYAVRGGKTTTSLHREVLSLKSGDPPVDHIDGDKLNCRRSNLRVVSHAVNMRNRASAARGDNRSSGFLGVSRHVSGKFRARIGVDGKMKSLGLFVTAEQANDARIKAEAGLWGVQPRRALAHEMVEQ